MEIELIDKKNISFSQKHKITTPGLNYLCQSLGLKTTIGMRDDKFIILNLITVNKLGEEKVTKIKNIGQQDDFVFGFETGSHDFSFGFPLIVHNTDSLVLSIKTEDITRDLKSIEDLFDFSYLDPDNTLFSNKNKRVLGKFEIETQMNSFVLEVQHMLLNVSIFRKNCQCI